MRAVRGAARRAHCTVRDASQGVREHHDAERLEDVRLGERRRPRRLQALDSELADKLGGEQAEADERHELVRIARPNVRRGVCVGSGVGPCGHVWRTWNHMFSSRLRKPNGTQIAIARPDERIAG